MSSLTQCNLCSLNRIKVLAKEKGLRVTVLADAEWGMGGLNVYVHPQGVKIATLPGGEDGVRKMYMRAWFMSLSDQCAC